MGNGSTAEYTTEYKAESTAESAPGSTATRSWLLLLRYALVNIVAMALSVAAWLQGWFDAALQGLTLWLIVVILGAFLIGLVICTWHVIKVSDEINSLGLDKVPTDYRSGVYLQDSIGRSATERQIHANLLRIELGNRVGGVRYYVNLLVFLGLIGTVIGFIIALAGVDAEAAQSAERVTEMVSGLIKGIAIALYTTLVGAILHIWLGFNARMLAQGSASLLQLAVQRGERNVGH